VNGLVFAKVETAKERSIPGSLKVQKLFNKIWFLKSNIHYTSSLPVQILTRNDVEPFPVQMLLKETGSWRVLTSFTG
jgi:hypothetical protein